MFSIGTDLVEIERIQTSLKSMSFLKRVYGKEEQDYFTLKKNWIESAAAFFAAKEAFGKALGTGIRDFSLNEVQVIHDNMGKPILLLSGNALTAAQGYCFDLSLSHTKNYANAVIIAWKEVAL